MGAERLIEVGPKGCTPIDNSGPRWSDYVFRLRQLGVVIDTLREPHHSEFEGLHARYVLRSNIEAFPAEGENV